MQPCSCSFRLKDLEEHSMAALWNAYKNGQSLPAGLRRPAVLNGVRAIAQVRMLAAIPAVTCTHMCVACTWELWLTLLSLLAWPASRALMHHRCSIHWWDGRQCWCRNMGICQGGATTRASSAPTVTPGFSKGMKRSGANFGSHLPSPTTRGALRPYRQSPRCAIHTSVVGRHVGTAAGSGTRLSHQDA